MSTADFYDALAPVYHLIYADWEASVERQGRALDSIIRSAGGEHLHSVLDAACGIGTQSIGLAGLGYRVMASDLSPAAVTRATREAARRGLPLRTSVADMRHVFDHHRRTFDVVIACDNAVPHLLSKQEIRSAFEQFFRCTAPGGLCLISVRDYEALELNGVQLHSYGVHQEENARYVLFQVWDCEPPFYDTTFYIIRHEQGAEPVTRAIRSTYYAVPIGTLKELMEQAGFTGVARLDDCFFQPVLVGHKPAAQQRDEGDRGRAMLSAE
jgi:SAM-dependent methyltransferase